MNTAIYHFASVKSRRSYSGRGKWNLRERRTLPHAKERDKYSFALKFAECKIPCRKPSSASSFFLIGVDSR